MKGFVFLFKKKKKGRALFSEMKRIMGGGIPGETLFYQHPNFYFLLLPPKQTKVKTHISARAGVKYSIGPIAYTTLCVSTCGFIPIGESDRTYECL